MTLEAGSHLIDTNTDLVRNPIDNALGIDNTTKLWTPLSERIELLSAALRSHVEVGRRLYETGYGVFEIYRAEGKFRSPQSISTTVRNVERPLPIEVIRLALPSGASWAMDNAVSVIRGLMSGDALLLIEAKSKHTFRNYTGLRLYLEMFGFQFVERENGPLWREFFGKEWLSLGNEIRRIAGSRPRKLGQIYDVLREKQFPVVRKTSTKDEAARQLDYYRFPKLERKNLERLLREEPELLG